MANPQPEIPHYKTPDCCTQSRSIAKKSSSKNDTASSLNSSCSVKTFYSISHFSGLLKIRKNMRVRCTMCCLRKSVRLLNVGLIVFGVGMIIYSLWLIKKWDEAVCQLSASIRSDLPRPWFILTCLGIGMVACLSTIGGYTAMNRTKHSVLCIYIASICSVVLLQGAVIVAIFFNMDLISKIIDVIDDDHVKFRKFIILHLRICRFLTIIVVIVEINLVVLAISLFVVGPDPTHHSRIHLLASVPDFRYSFLIPPNPPGIVNNSHFTPIVLDEPRDTHLVDKDDTSIT